MTPQAELSEVEKKELKKTESEVVVAGAKFICVVHKGPIEGRIYLCPHCHTLYCVKCAGVLKDKGEKCWSCEKDFDIRT